MLCGRFSSNGGQAATPPAQAGRGGLPTRPWPRSRISLGDLGRFVFEGHRVFAGMILVGAGNGYRLFAKLRAFQHSGLVLGRLAENFAPSSILALFWAASPSLKLAI